MSKELEAFMDILGILSAVTGCDVDTDSEHIKIVKQALQRLESIDNAEPSEALKKLEMLSDCAKAMKEAPSSNWIEYANNETELDYQLWRAYEDLKQSLLNAEKEHKALEIIKEKRINVGTFIHLTKVLKKDYEQCKETNDIVFCNICDTEKEFLTEEEFNILKETLE